MRSFFDSGGHRPSFLRKISSIGIGFAAVFAVGLFAQGTPVAGTGYANSFDNVNLVNCAPIGAVGLQNAAGDNIAAYGNGTGASPSIMASSIGGSSLIGSVHMHVAKPIGGDMTAMIALGDSGGGYATRVAMARPGGHLTS